MNSKKRLLSLALALLFALGLAPAITPPATAAPNTGWYTGDGPYTIGTADELAGLAQLVNAGNSFFNKTITLTANIDLSAYTSWTPIGSTTSFDGTFDGGGHVITNLTVSATTYAGLFGYINSGGKVQNLGIVGGSVTATGGDRAGGVAGENYGTIENCYNTADVSVSDGSGNDCAGGVAGWNIGTITGCYNTGTVTISDGSGNNSAGGVAGYNDGTITNCYNTGAVTISGGSGSNSAGGVAGGNVDGTITGCYNTGTVSAIGGSVSNEAGGVAGYNDGTITGCYFLNTSASFGVGVDNSGAAETNSILLTDMTDTDALTNAIKMPALADPFVKPNYTTTGNGCYTGAEFFPELEVFADSQDGLTRYMSKLSVLTGSPSTCATPVAGEEYFLIGDGSAATPYEIATPGQLSHVRQHLGANTHFELMCDLDLDGIDWSPIGNNSKPFNGTFDGGGHVITSLTVNVTTNAGLFGYIGTDGEVQNLGIVGGTVTASGGTFNYAGGVAGQNYGTITNCYNTGKVEASSGTENYAGGVAGWNNSGGAITNCYNTGNVEASGGTLNYAGGVAGQNSGTITNCYNTGNVEASSSSFNYAGGVAGRNNSGGAIITGCYNTGNVEASGGNDNYAGGVAGQNSGGGTISGCYRWAGVTVNGSVVDANDANVANGGALSAHALLTQATYNGNGWNFTGIWTWDEAENYPKLGFGPEVYPFAFIRNSVTVNGGGTGASGAGSYYDGETVSIDAGSRSGYSFTGWTSDDLDVETDLEDADSAQTFFIMPLGAVEVTATWKQVGGASLPPVTSTTYTVSFNTNGGSAVASQSVTSGGKTARPADPVREGYEFTGWYTDPECTKPYDFSAPVSGGLTLYAGWREIEAPQPGLPGMFRDVNGHWAEAFINSLGALGYIDGFGDGVFGPESSLTRAQFVQVIFNVFGDTEQYGVPFEDCDPDGWYAQALGWAYGSGIIDGYSPEVFGPDDAITREQMAVLITRIAERFGITLPDTGGYTPFADDERISVYAREAVYAMQSAGIIAGKDGNRFDPQGTLTRAELAKVLYYVLDYAGMVAEEYRV